MRVVGWACRSVFATGVILIGAATVQAGTASAATSPNLIHNPGAEAGPGSPTGGVVSVPGWTETTGTSFTAVQYGAPGGFPTPTSPGPAKRGVNFFAGGPGSDNVVAVQTIKLANYVSAIKAGKASFTVSGWIGGSGALNDSGFVEVDWKNNAGDLVGTSATIGPATAAQRGDVTGLLHFTAGGKIPKSARSAFVQLSLFSATQGAPYDFGLADNLSLTVKTP
jgi:hypothetical protein